MSKKSKIIAFGLLAVMFILMYTSEQGDSATMDELAHIPSGYSYMTKQDYRLNPEHPPLIKDLSAIPLLFLHLNFPVNVPAWTEYINGQWDMGRIFIYESGNDAEKIIHSARLPIMLLAILFGWLLFRWAAKMYCDKTALLTLFFFTLSPTFIAHSRYVTTDLAAAFGFFIGIAAFINYLYTPNNKNLIITGIAFGTAQLLKFSLVLLGPIYVILAGLWIILNKNQFAPEISFAKYILREILNWIGKIAAIGAIGLIVIWPVYQFHVWNYPVERQLNDTQFTLQSFGIRPLADSVVWMADKPILRAWGQYFLGVLMVIQRASGGNTGYFMGNVSAAGSLAYFPLLYLLKEHLAFHILTVIALLFTVKNIFSSEKKNINAITKWMRMNFTIMASLIFIGIYILQSVASNLNIGVRHILPTFPFIYLLVSRQTIKWLSLNTLNINLLQGFWEAVKSLLVMSSRYLIKRAIFFGLLLWILISTISAAPYFLSYYNILGGGVKNGYQIAVDSNYDWGQDLLRLQKWVNEYNSCARTKSPQSCAKKLGDNVPIEFNQTIENTKIDYFGGGNPQYYFGEKFQPWQSSKGKPEPGNWFALSATFLQSARGTPIKNFQRNPADEYPWLMNKKPVARAGASIFIYKF